MIKMNLSEQIMYGIKLRLIPRKDYKNKKAKRYTLNNSNQNIWIPNKHLDLDGTIKKGENLVYIFKTDMVKNKIRLSYRRKK